MVLSSMAFWLFFITLLYIPMRQTLCELPAPHPREPHCAQKDFRDLHAVFPRAAAVSCTSGPLRMSTGVCKRGFGPNGKLPQAVCCLIVTVDSETAVWKDVKGNACVKIENSTTSAKPTQPTTPNDTQSVTHRKTHQPTSMFVSSSVAPTAFTTVPVRPWFTMSTNKWHSGGPQNVTWKKANCILFYANEIVINFGWKKKSYKFNSTIFQADMKSIPPNITCSGSKHVLSGGWYKESHNITFSVTFEKSNGSWYATHMEHNDTSLKTNFRYDNKYFKAPLGNSFHCGQSTCRSNDGLATIVFHNITVQPFQVSGVQFSSKTSSCPKSSSTWTSELTVLIVCISVGSIALFIIIAYVVIRCSRSEYDFLK
ncbi:uncharacterized protein LOC134196285 [Corticium candelabrum]|uniref:uncharacterized protein LOC134196285 n=1 Tax=Corticium candelabrum TaxID=121492 RepID=UPI002E267B07|nr:uncharacterized protein LOC134196285 [Corticium candelabrum]